MQSVKPSSGTRHAPARLCVVLGVRGDSPCYALMPAARVAGEPPKFARQGKHDAPNEVEIGPLVEDAETLAGRIAERLRAKH